MEFVSFSEIANPVKVCPSCLLSCGEPKEYYVVVFQGLPGACECPVCRHRPLKIKGSTIKTCEDKQR